MDASTEVEAEFVSEETMRDEWQWSEILFSILTPYNVFVVAVRNPGIPKMVFIFGRLPIELRTASSPPI